MRNNTYKILFIFVILLILIIFPFSNSDKNDFKVPMPVDDLSVGYYQSTTCSISLWEVMTLNYSSQQDLHFNNNTYPGSECFGKVTGLDKVKEKYIVSIGTNTSINLLVQSFIWLLLIIFIKPGKNQEEGISQLLKHNIAQFSIDIRTNYKKVLIEQVQHLLNVPQYNIQKINGNGVSRIINKTMELL